MNEQLKTSSKNTGEEGFSLVEIMVTVLIMTLLSVVVFVNVFPNFERSQAAKARTDIASLENALELYRLQMLSYPTIEQGLDALVEAPDNLNAPERYPTEGFIKRLPDDPWGAPYQYEYPGQNGTVDIYSFGADGELGGEGLNADIGNWTF